MQRNPSSRRPPVLRQPAQQRQKAVTPKLRQPSPAKKGAKRSLPR